MMPKSLGNIKGTSGRLSLSTQLIVNGVILKSIEKENQSESLALCITACGTIVHSTQAPERGPVPGLIESVV